MIWFLLIEVLEEGSVEVVLERPSQLRKVFAKLLLTMATTRLVSSYEFQTNQHELEIASANDALK